MADIPEGILRQALMPRSISLDTTLACPRWEAINSATYPRSLNSIRLNQPRPPTACLMREAITPGQSIWQMNVSKQLTTTSNRRDSRKNWQMNTDKFENNSISFLGRTTTLSSLTETCIAPTLMKWDEGGLEKVVWISENSLTSAFGYNGNFKFNEPPTVPNSLQWHSQSLMALAYILTKLRFKVH